jgi:tyrosine-protein phosphatase SIW14
MVRTQTRAIALAGVLASFVLIFVSQVCWSQTDKLQGLSNFGQVSNTLFRGAQPSTDGYTPLHNMGVSIIVNFRDEASEIATEKRQVESAGMKYVGIPWNGHNQPSNSQVAQFLELVRANPDARIFVHCKAGADRTGVMVAAYRIALEHKAVADAVAEMHRYHYKWFFLPHLERYVKSLPQLLQTEADFSSLVSKPPVNQANIPFASAAVAHGPFAVSGSAH